MGRRMLAPINSIKHYVATTNITVAAAAATTIVAVDAVQGAAVNTFDVEEGSIVKAIHFELWLIGVGAVGTTAQYTAIIEKLPSNAVNPTVTNMLNLQAYPNKKNILWSFQGNVASFQNGSNAIPIIRDWLKIPKGKQRMGFGDRVALTVMSVAESGQVCGLFTYKEYK